MFSSCWLFLACVYSRMAALLPQLTELADIVLKYPLIKIKFVREKPLLSILFPKYFNWPYFNDFAVHYVFKNTRLPQYLCILSIADQLTLLVNQCP